MTGFNPFDNPAFRVELSKLLDEKLAPLKELRDQVEDHEATLQRSKGAMAALVVVWSIVVAGLEYLFHKSSA
jgi:hypothetical protein